MQDQDNSGKQNAKFLGKIKELSQYRETWVRHQDFGGIHRQDTDDLLFTVSHNPARLELEKLYTELRIVACVNFCAGVSTEMLEANTLLAELEKGRKLAGELGKKLGEIPETSERYFIGTENGIADIETPPSDN